MTLGEVIKKYRKEHGLSMDAFSNLSGISKAYISVLEKNQHGNTKKPVAPSLKCIKAAADAMGMDFNKLFNELDGNVSLTGAENMSNVLSSQTKRLIVYLEALNYEGLNLAENYLSLLIKSGEYSKE